VLSYNESSWKPIEEIITLLKKYRSDIVIKKKEYQYQYRKNESEEIEIMDVDGNISTEEKRSEKRAGYEFLIICK
jgi:hypothetical protein